MKFIKSHIFEISVVTLYIFLSFFFSHKILLALKEGGLLIIKILPIFICVMFFASFLSNYISSTFVKKFIGEESGILGIIIGIIIGTIFVGPLWVIFPLYKELLNKGAKISIIVAMMASFAIKTPWLPYAATFLGWNFVLITLFLIILYAVFQGFIMELLLKK